MVVPTKVRDLVDLVEVAAVLQHRVIFRALVESLTLEVDLVEMVEEHVFLVELLLELVEWVHRTTSRPPACQPPASGGRGGRSRKAA